FSMAVGPNKGPPSGLGMEKGVGVLCILRVILCGILTAEDKRESFLVCYHANG
ncbi:hypothetical protein Tco_1342386, partial [Tanacetum coccineum]